MPAPSGSFGGHGANGRRLVVEVDGDAVHSSRSSFERGRRRDAELHAGGSRVIRVTWRRITVERDALVATLALATARP